MRSNMNRLGFVSLTLVLGISVAGNLGCLTPKPAEAASGESAEKRANASPGERLSLTAEDLAKKVKLKPGVWDQKAATKIEAAGAEITLKEVSNAKRLELSFGNAHSYDLTFFNGKNEVGKLTVWTRKGTHRAQMIKRRPKLSDEISKAGFDRIVINPHADNRYSLAGFKLLD